jgi:hypothetical protein
MSVAVVGASTTLRRVLQVQTGFYLLGGVDA